MLRAKCKLPAISLAFLLGAGFAASVQAEESRKNCDSLFPDFSCPGHSGRYEGFVAPASAPYLFEDPFITTNVSAWHIWHAFPNRMALQGGHLNVVAVQARLAITERIGFIATADGFTWIDPDLPLLNRGVGLNDIAAGFKYLLIDRPESGFALSPDLRVQIPIGDRDVFHGNGDGILLGGVSSAYGYKGFHLLSHLGLTLPFDPDDSAAMLHGHLQMDFPIIEQIRPFAGMNWYHYLNDGDGSQKIRTRVGTLTIDAANAATGSKDIGGLDYAALGSSGIASKDIVTLTVGLRLPLTKHVSLSGAYEIPVTENKDVLAQRVTSNLMFEF